MVKHRREALDEESMSGKTIWIQMRGGPPWGFRLKGGKGAEAPLTISMVNAKGRQQGLKEGDRVISVNGQPTAEMTHAEAQRKIKESAGNLELQIERRVPQSNGGMNGSTTVKSWGLDQNSSHISHRLAALEEDANRNNSWSTDSTSTGSTIIHISPQSSEEQSSGTERVWSPSTKRRANLKLNCDMQYRNESVEVKPLQQAKEQSSIKEKEDEDDTSPVWQPFGAPYDGPQFRPVKLEVTTTTRKATAVPRTEQTKPSENETTEVQTTKPTDNAENGENTVKAVKESTEKSPETNTTTTSTTFVKSGWSSHLPPSQSPTITLLQKAREGQLPKGAIYIDEKPDSTPLPKNAILIDQKVTVDGDKVHTDSYYAVPTLTTQTTIHDIKAPSKYDGIGPTEYGIPVGLRTGVKEEYASDWYKTMYKSLHRGKYPGEPNQAVHFGGYMSEPEFDRKDVYRTKYSATEHRRKPEKSVSYTAERPSTDKAEKPESDSSVIRHEPRKYKVEPRSIAEYQPGHSSLAEKEFQKFWSDFWDSMDDLHEHFGNVSPRNPQQGLNRRWANVFLSDGYESDSTLIRKTGRNPQVDPEQQKAWYKEIQKGGEIPLIGLRKSVPEKPTETRSNKPQPATHLYGAEPPCFNHKHIPNTSYKFTPSYVFHANPVSKSSFLKQNYNMSMKRYTPVPPARHSSKRIPVIRSIVSNAHPFCESNLKSSSSSENLSPMYLTRNMNYSNGRLESIEAANEFDRIRHYKQYYSNEDLSRSSWPPAGCSSKQTPVLQSVVSDTKLFSETNFKSSSENESPMYAIRNMSSSNGGLESIETTNEFDRLRRYKQYYSNEDLFRSSWPPARCSSKQTPVLQSVVSDTKVFSETNFKSSSENESPIYAIRNMSSSNGRLENIEATNELDRRPFYKQYYSNKDRFGSSLQELTHSKAQFDSHGKVSHCTDRNFNNCENFHIDAMNISGTMPIVCPHGHNYNEDRNVQMHYSPSCHHTHRQANHQRHFTQNDSTFQYPCHNHFGFDGSTNSPKISGDYRTVSAVLDIMDPLLVAYRDNENRISNIYATDTIDSAVNLKSWNCDPLNAYRSWNQNNQYSELIRNVDAVISSTSELLDSYSVGPKRPNNDNQLGFNHSKHLNDFKENPSLVLRNCTKTESSLDHIPYLLNHDNTKQYFSSNNNLPVCQSSSVSKSPKFLKDSIQTSCQSSSRNGSKFVKAVCLSKDKDTEIKQNLDSFEMRNKVCPSKSLPPMITILPSVYVTKISTANITPKVVHSEPQVYKKHLCKVDLNPLKMYLNRYSEDLQKFGESNFQSKHASDIRINGCHKLNLILHDSVDVCLNNLTFSKGNIFREAKNISEFISRKNNSAFRTSKPSHDEIAAPFENRCQKSVLKSLPSIPTNIYKLPDTNTQISFVKNRKNIFMDKNNVILYHQYIASMVQSIVKSKKFLHLKNFYSSLEHVNRSSFTHTDIKFNAIKIKNFDFSWGKISKYQKWEKDQDKNLKVKHSSVEDLRHLFQSVETTKTSKSRNQVSFHYRKLWYNVSVSNLVKKYNNMQSVQESLQVQLSSEVCYDSGISKKCSSHMSLKSISQYSVPVSFLRLYPFPQNMGVSSYNSSESFRTTVPSFSTSISSSSSDLRMAYSTPIRGKVQYFEEMSQAKSLRKHVSIYHYTALKVGKFSHSRNLSWSDLRNLDDGTTPHDKNVFSPQYLPEKAMSCLDLSFASECSHSTIEPSLTNSERRWGSSTASCISEEDTEKGGCKRFRSIQTGTVARLKHKLERSIHFSRSQSVPQNISSVTSRSNATDKSSKLCSYERPLLASAASPGSVHNLKHIFESEKSDMASTNSSNSVSKINSFKNPKARNYFLYRKEIETEAPTKTNYGSENSLTIPNNCVSEMDDDRGSFMEQCMKNRIQSLIAKFEGGSSLGILKSPVKGFGGIVLGLNVSRNYQNSLNHNSVSKTEVSVSFNGQNITSCSMTTMPSKSKFEEVSGSAKVVNKLGRAPVHAENWMKYFPRVRNSFPKPYVKKANNICSPLKICHPASPHQYQETEVNIHYRSPIRHLEKEYIEEEELRKRQEDAMRKFYEEERRKKHQQELAEIEMRRHSDFFTPSQKSPIPLNRYDNPFDSSYGNRLAPPGIHRGPPPKTMARTLFPFTAQTTRELSLNKGDIVYITKQIDRNWYEGEHHGLIGIFPVSYVEIIPNEKANLQPRKAMEGEAIVKYNFRALTPIELSLFKGEKVVLTKRMDQNWYEGRLGPKKGIFPVSYVNVLQEPGEFTSGNRAISPRPPASPVNSPIVNGSPSKVEGPTFNTGLRPLQEKPPLNMDRIDTKSSLTQSLHIDTYNEPIPYRSLYSYKPQNDDELELKEGDTVYVMEKCDDGWYVGTSLRTGLFGTFPGNYVERI